MQYPLFESMPPGRPGRACLGRAPTPSLSRNRLTTVFLWRLSLGRHPRPSGRTNNARPQRRRGVPQARPSRPGGFYKFRSICPRQMVSIGMRLERGSAAFHRASGQAFLRRLETTHSFQSTYCKIYVNFPFFSYIIIPIKLSLYRRLSSCGKNTKAYR